MATPIALQNLLTASNPRYSNRMTGEDLARTAGATALGIGSNNQSLRQLQAQLEMEQQKLDELALARKNAITLGLIESGYTGAGEGANLTDTERIIQQITGESLKSPTTSSMIESIRSGGASSTPKQSVYLGYGASRPETQKEYETRIMNSLSGVKPMSGNIKLGNYVPADVLKRNAEEALRKRSLTARRP